MKKEVFLDFNLDKFRVDVDNTTASNFHKFIYNIHGETIGNGESKFVPRSGPMPMVFEPFPGGNDARVRETIFNIPENAQVGDKIIYVPGTDIDFFNYDKDDFMNIHFSHNGPPTKKGGVVIRDSNYPPPLKQGITDAPPDFDQVILSSQFKIQSMEFEKAGSAYNTLITLLVAPGQKYMAQKTLVGIETEDALSDILLLVVSDSGEHVDTITFTATINFSALTNKSIPVVIWKGGPGLELDQIQWPTEMRKKGVVSIE